MVIQKTLFKGVLSKATVFNESSPELSWRLVHDGVKVLNLFEAVGYTSAINTLFVGTKDGCLAEIARLGLTESVPDPVPVPESLPEDPINI